MNRLPVCAPLALVALLLVGCAEPPTTTPTGAVAANGAPVERGTITFSPTSSGTTVDGIKIKPVSVAITDGRYAVPPEHKMAPGEYQVIILGERRTGRKISADPLSPPTEDEWDDFIPPKFNSRSQLVETIAEGESTVDFNLEF